VVFLSWRPCRHPKGIILNTGIGVIIGMIIELILSLFRKWFVIGLTEKRLIIVPLKKSNGNVVSIQMSDINSIMYSRPGSWISASFIPGHLSIKYQDNKLRLKSNEEQWQRRSFNLASAFSKLNVPQIKKSKIDDTYSEAVKLIINGSNKTKITKLFTSIGYDDLLAKLTAEALIFANTEVTGNFDVKYRREDLSDKQIQGVYQKVSEKLNQGSSSHKIQSELMFEGYEQRLATSIVHAVMLSRSSY
jgi:hypothetical protein